MNAAAARAPARVPLAGAWYVCPCEPDAPMPSTDSSRWTPIEGPMTAAAALRASGAWSLDSPAHAFDAKEWWFRATFDAPAGHDEAVLGFDGLATSCEAWLNDSPILHSTSMFVAHECQVTPLLRPRGNELRLRFHSLDALLQAKRPRPQWRAPMVAHQQLRWWRTTLLGRTPGWSPPCAPVGPWRDVWIERRKGERACVEIDADVQGNAGTVTCRFRPGGGALPASVDLRLHRQGRVEVQALDWNAASQSFEGRLRVADVARWWPHSHGEPALYDASLVLRSPGNETSMPAGRVGFRTIGVDQAGGRFSIVVNGVPVFCRGALWTPLDPVSLRSSPAQCEAAVAQVRDCGMNLVRIAGTNVYEEDHFYDACDEQGVLVWQDFMFANMDFPGDDDAFRALAETEARQQVQRLRGHACIAVLCGNSESEQQAAMWGATRDRWQPALFHEVLPAVCGELAPRIPYWPSSAHGGTFPDQADAGTTSYYGVGAYLRPLDDARRCGLSFATECLAFANVPCAETIARMPAGVATRAHNAGWKERSPRDLGAGWDFDDVRDHYVHELCGVDPQRLRATDHERYLMLGRIATGEMMAASFAEWRRPRSGCHGAVVLMMRDLWAGAGWGVVDDRGQPKASWHYLKRVLQPLALTITDEGVNGLAVHVVNDGPEARRVSIELTAWRNGDVKVASGTQALAVEAHGGLTLPAVGMLDHFMDLGYAYRFGPLPCDAVVATLRDDNGMQLAQAFHFPAGLLLAQDAGLGLTAFLESAGDTSATVRVATKRFATAVHFETPGFEPDNDFFHLPPGDVAHVRLHRTGDRPLAGFVHALNGAHPVRIDTAKS